MTPSKPERFLALLRETHPDFAFIYTNGGCYHLYLILKSLWPEAELWYQDNPGHVFAKIGSSWYDINGKYRFKPRGARPITARQLGDPWKWKFRLVKMMDETLLQTMHAVSAQRRASSTRRAMARASSSRRRGR